MTYQSNAQQVIDRIKNKLLSSNNIDKLLKTIATDIYAAQLHRIHNEGKNRLQHSIGRYSTKPMYVNPDKSPKKFPKKGKKGKTEFKDGRPHKTGYFEQGYKGYRSKIGRETSFVNLEVTGSLRTDYKVEKNPNGIGYVIGFMSKKKSEIAKGQEEHFGGGVKIWALSELEKGIVKREIKKFAQSNAKSR